MSGSHNKWPMRDAWLAHIDERGIEEEAYRNRRLYDKGLHNDESVKLEIVCAEALCQLDELKARGTYEYERSKLVKKVPVVWGDDPSTEIAPRFQRLVDLFDNLNAGMNSPDLEQRKRFVEFLYSDVMKSVNLAEAEPILAVLEPAKRRQGRKPHFLPWQSVSDQMSEMRIHVLGSGHSIPAAARMVATAEGFAHQESRAKLLERRFREKMRLRELGK
jgi:hypothetical protein